MRPSQMLWMIFQGEVAWLLAGHCLYHAPFLGVLTKNGMNSLMIIGEGCALTKNGMNSMSESTSGLTEPGSTSDPRSASGSESTSGLTEPGSTSGLRAN